MPEQLRRELQRMHLFMLNRILNQAAQFYPRDAATLAHADLLRLTVASAAKPAVRGVEAAATRGGGAGRPRISQTNEPFERERWDVAVPLRLAILMMSS